MVGPFPLKLPIVDIHTIGAGGGSIAAVTGAGRLSVGPRSAGAEPGPVCYGRGGERAHRHRRAPGARAASRRRCWAARSRSTCAAARAAIAARIGRPLRLGRRGGGRRHRRDHRQLHGPRDPHRLGRPRPRPAALRAGRLRRRGAAPRLPPRRAARHPDRDRAAAAGRALHVGPARHRHPLDVRAHRGHRGARPARRRGRRWRALEAGWRELEAQARAWLDGEQVPRERQRFERAADLRYEHQSFELTCPLGEGPLTAAAARASSSRRSTPSTAGSTPTTCRARRSSW